MKKISTQLLTTTLGILIAGGAFSQVQAADTLAKIKKSGKL